MHSNSDSFSLNAKIRCRPQLVFGFAPSIQIPAFELTGKYHIDYIELLKLVSGWLELYHD